MYRPSTVCATLSFVYTKTVLEGYEGIFAFVSAMQSSSEKDAGERCSGLTDFLTSDLTWDCTLWRAESFTQHAPLYGLECGTPARFARCCAPHHVSSRAVCLHASPLVATHTQLTCAISVPASSFSMCSTRQAHRVLSCGTTSTSDRMLACPLLWDARIGLHVPLRGVPVATCPPVHSRFQGLG